MRRPVHLEGLGGVVGQQCDHVTAAEPGVVQHTRQRGGVVVELPVGQHIPGLGEDDGGAVRITVCVGTRVHRSGGCRGRHHNGVNPFGAVIGHVDMHEFLLGVLVEGT